MQSDPASWYMAAPNLIAVILASAVSMVAAFDDPRVAAGVGCSVS